MGIILALEILLKPFAICYENRGLRHTVCELLRSQADFEICEQAENGKEAIEKAQQLRPDLIVLDFSMPIMDGLHAARVLKRMLPTVPLIMFSASADGVFEEATCSRRFTAS